MGLGSGGASARGEGSGSDGVDGAAGAAGGTIVGGEGVLVTSSVTTLVSGVSPNVRPAVSSTTLRPRASTLLLSEDSSLVCSVSIKRTRRERARYQMRRPTARRKVQNDICTLSRPRRPCKEEDYRTKSTISSGWVQLEREKTSRVMIQVHVVIVGQHSATS